MISKRTTEIRRSDLDQLLSDHIAESKTLDYKKELPQDKADFLEDVTALANSSGGDLILGMAAEDGIPVRYSPIQGPPDQQILALENAIRDGIEPRLVATEFWPVQVSEGQYVYVVRVKRSWNGPHRVTKTRRFMGRNSRGNYPLDVTELRSAFALSESVPERARAFRANRTMRVYSGDTPVELAAGPKVLVHMVPLSALLGERAIDLREVDTMRKLPLIEIRTEDYRRNLDGVLSYDRQQPIAPARAYTQLFHNGAIEAVCATGLSDQGHLFPTWFDTAVPKAIRLYLRLLAQGEVAAPIFLFFTLLGLRGVKLVYKGMWLETSDSLDRDVASFPEIVLDGFEFDDKECKEFIDQVWQAFGRREAPE